MPLSLDEILAPAREGAPTETYTFERLRGRPRFDVRPASARNPQWLEFALVEDLKAGGEEPASAPADESQLARHRREMHDEVEMFATALIVGVAVQEEADGPWVPRAYTPALGRDFLHQLIDADAGPAEFGALRRFVHTMTARYNATLNPEKTAGNSSSG